MTDRKGTALCDVEGCQELARHVETGDGHAVRNPKKRCHGHHSDHGLWRDVAFQVARDIHRDGDA